LILGFDLHQDPRRHGFFRIDPLQHGREQGSVEGFHLLQYILVAAHHAAIAHHQPVDAGTAIQ
jgi:hypothetical protein